MVGDPSTTLGIIQRRPYLDRLAEEHVRQQRQLGLVVADPGDVEDDARVDDIRVHHLRTRGGEFVSEATVGGIERKG